MGAQPKFTTAISAVRDGQISIRGQDIATLVSGSPFTDTLALVIHGKAPSPQERRMLDGIFAAAADHGFVATCTSVTRYAASGSGSLPASVAAGLLSLGSGTAVPHLVASLLLEISDGDEYAAIDDERIATVLRTWITNGERVPGLGHPVHRSGDPRTTALRELARSNDCYDGYVHLMDRVETNFETVTGKRLTQNVDGIIAAVLLHFGWSPDEMYGLTLLALTPSLIAHALEEISQHHVMRIIPEDQADYLLFETE